MFNELDLYKFKVIGTKTTFKGNIMYEIVPVDSEGDDSHYFVFKLKCEKEDFLPDFLYCRFYGYDDLGRPKLAQDEYSLLKEYYISGNAYNFYVEREITESKKGERRFVISSDCKLQHVCTVHHDENLKIGEKVKLTIFFKRDNDSLFLFFQKSAEDLGIFKPEMVFKLTNHSELFESHFMQIDNWIKYLDSLDGSIAEMREKIANGNRLWFFDYLNILLAYSYRIDKEDLETIKQTNILIRDLERWLLEESGLLKTFSQEKRDETCLKSEHNKEKAECCIEAVEILQENGQAEYLHNVLCKIRQSMYLKNKEHVFKVLFEIIVLDDAIIPDFLEEFSEIIWFASIDTKDIFLKEKLTQKLSYYIYGLKKQVNQELHYKRINEVDTNVISKLVIGIGTLLNIQNVSTDTDSYNKRNLWFSDLCKYSSYLTSRDKALELINKSLIISFQKNEIENINSNILSKSISQPNVLVDYILKLPIPTVRNKISTIRNQVYLIFENQQLFITKAIARNITSNADAITYPLYSIPGTDLNVITFNQTKPWENSDSILYYKNKWNELFSSPNDNEKDEDSEYAYVETKNIEYEYTNIIFCKTLNKLQKEEGVISANGYTKDFYIADMREIFCEKMIFKAKKIIREDGKIEYNIIDNLKQYSNMLAQETNTEVEGICINVDSVKREAVFVTTNGIICKTHLSSNDRCLINQSYELSVDIDPQENNYPLALILGFSEKRLIASELLKNQLIGLSSYNRKKLSEPADQTDTFPYIHLIIDNYIRLFEDKIIRYNLYQIAYYISFAERSYLTNYYSSCIQHMEMLECFTENIPINDDGIYNSWKDSEQNDNSYLKKYSDIHRILKDFGHEEDIEYLYHLAQNNNDDEQIVRFAKLALSASLIASVSDDDRPIAYLKALLISEINGSKDSKDIPYDIIEETDDFDKESELFLSKLGNEGQNLEFKTSIIYYAGDSDNNPNPDEQMFVIMKVIDGFLNANGGTLLIGIKDDKSISGIESDLQYLNCNEDKYERMIRNKIVSSFSKDVNSTITIKFLHSENKTICKINIPEYETPISLKSDFYQRQGNETRIIKGDDLIMFIRRKLEGKAPIINNVSVEHDTVIDEQRDNYTCIASDKPNPTTSLESKLVFNINFCADGSYIAGDITPDRNTIVTAQIDLSLKNNFLLQCYDNGCVNKVSLKNLSNIKLGYQYKNGLSKDGRLLNLMILSNDDCLIVLSQQHDIKYIKAIPISTISAHTTLGLRGNQFLSQNYDKVLSWNYVKSEDIHNIEKLICSSRANLGRKVSSSKISKELAWFNKNILGRLTTNPVKYNELNKENSIQNNTDPKSITSYFDNLICRGSMIPRARMEAQNILKEARSSEDFWMKLNALLDSDINIFRKPIIDTITENVHLSAFQPSVDVLSSVVNKLFTFDQKYYQSIELIYPFRHQLAEKDLIYIKRIVHGLNDMDYLEHFFEIVKASQTQRIEYLVSEESVTSYFYLYRYLQRLAEQLKITREDVQRIQHNLNTSVHHGKIIAALININILKSSDSMSIPRKVLSEIEQNELNYFQNICQAQANRERSNNYLVRIEDYVGKIITGKIIRNYQNHYLIHGIEGVSILLQHDWASSKHYVDDKVTVKIVSASTQFKSLFGTEIDDSIDLPTKKALLDEGTVLEVSFSEYNGSYIPKLRNTFSNVKATVISYPQNFNFHKKYLATVYRKKSDFEYYIKLIKTID